MRTLSQPRYRSRALLVTDTSPSATWAPGSDWDGHTVRAFPKSPEMLSASALKRTHSVHLERFRRHSGRLLSPLPLLATAGGMLVLLGGTMAIIAGCCLLLLVVDRALPAGGAALPYAERSFRGLMWARRRDAILRRLRGRARPEQRLLCLSEDRGSLALAQRRELGVQTIDVESIVGTVESNKADAFDSRFRPPRWSRLRWTHIWQAAERGTELPPISVYRLADRHFVRDGHHRVSVARARAAAGIEADVVELRPPRLTSATRKETRA
jgi:hypothetical protein